MRATLPLLVTSLLVASTSLAANDRGAAIDTLGDKPGPELAAQQQLAPMDAPATLAAADEAKRADALAAILDPQPVDPEMAELSPEETMARIFIIASYWELVGSGQFNNDGRQDLLWRNTVTGQNSVWFMNGTTLLGSAYLPTVTDLDWVIEAVADLNGDGQSDLFWRNRSTTQVAVWVMTGTTVAQAKTLGNVPVPPGPYGIVETLLTDDGPGAVLIDGNIDGHCAVGPYTAPSTGPGVRAYYDGHFGWLAAAANTATVWSSYSTDGGSTWNWVAAEGWADWATNPAGGWNSSHRSSYVDLTPGKTYYFGLDAGGSSFTPDDTRCHLRVILAEH